MPPIPAIRVKGLRDLEAAFKIADKALSLELRAALRDAAEPVRTDAERLARTGIRNIGPVWSQMRTGITTRVVYVAPKARTRSGNPRLKRPNLALLLLGRSMEPALEENIIEVEARVGLALDTVGRAWEAA